MQKFPWPNDGFVIDGSGAPAFKSDLGIDYGNIAALAGRLSAPDHIPLAAGALKFTERLQFLGLRYRSVPIYQQTICAGYYSWL